MRKSEQFYEVLEKSLAKRLLNMYPAEKHAEVKPFVDWARKLPNENWSLWAIRNHRQNPKAFTDQAKQHIEHFAGSQHIPEIAKVRFDKEHTLDHGINALRGAESAYNERIKGNLNLVSTPKGATKIHDFGDGHAWWSLGKGSCKAEGKAMGHCGNVPSEEQGHDVLSLRKEHVIGGKKYYEPHLTFINDKESNVLGEMKGRANEKPSAKYHPYIKELIKKGYAPLGGGYEHEKNFSMADMSDEDQKEILQHNPRALVDNKHASSDHISQALKDKHLRVRVVAAKHPNATAEHIAQALKDKDTFVRMSAAKHTNATAEHIAQALKDKDRPVRSAAAENPNATAEHLSQAMKDRDALVRVVAAKHPNATAEHLSQALKDKEDFVRDSAASHPNATAEHITQALADPMTRVRIAAVKNPNATAEHLSQALNDDEIVSAHVFDNPNATAEHISAGLRSMSDGVRAGAAKHPNATAEHLSQAMNDTDWTIRRSAAKHPNATAEHLSQAMKDKEDFVRVAAANHPRYEEYKAAGLLKSRSEQLRNRFEDLRKGRFKEIEMEVVFSLADDENDLLKVEEAPRFPGQVHKDKGYVAQKHATLNRLMWTSAPGVAANHDSKLSDPKLKEQFLSRFKTHNHKMAMSAVIDRIAKDPHRHFIPTEENGRHILRARHIKALMLGHGNYSIDTSDPSRLSITNHERHGSYRGPTTYSFAIKVKGDTSGSSNK